MTKIATEKEQIQLHAHNIEQALQSARAWSGTAFTHWQGTAARTAGGRIDAFYEDTAAGYLRALRQATQGKRTRRGNE